MIEIVFDQSAGASLEIEQKKRGKRNAAKQSADGLALSGQPGDVGCLALQLSIGPIAGDVFGAERKRALTELYRVFPEGAQAAKTQLECARRDFASIAERAQKGEALRIWYSERPEERCGLCWLLAQSGRWPGHGRIWLIQLPGWETDAGGTVTQKSGWGEVAPGQWARYLALQREAPPALCIALAMEWQALQKENAPLRTVINGRLASVPVDFYDAFIQKEIDGQPETFQQAVVVGRILGRYQLGVPDSWIAQRIEEMVRAGLLAPVTQTEEGCPGYHRLLKKTSRW